MEQTNKNIVAAFLDILQNPAVGGGDRIALGRVGHRSSIKGVVDDE